MTGRRDNETKSSPAIRVDLAARVRARSAEIENAIFLRIRDLSEPVGDEDPAYVAGLERAVAKALKYGLEGIEKGPGSLPIPSETIQQARRAAREGVRLDTILRRYTAGNKSLEEFVVAEAADVPSRVLCQILSDQIPHVDRLLESAADEYRDELKQTNRSAGQKQAELILHFLNGDGLEGPVGIDYDFNLWHVGLILTGQGGELTMRGLARRAGCRSLTVPRDHETVWAWLGSTRKLDMAELARILGEEEHGGVAAAIGEPRQGPNGWRQTLREAQVALQVMLYRPQPVTRCRDVILVSAIIRSPWLAMSLIETYLTPLNDKGGSGDVLRRTLRAYFEADRNVASAAAALGVARPTVQRHLRRVEERLGQTLDICSAQLQVALSAEELVGGTGQLQQPFSA